MFVALVKDRENGNTKLIKSTEHCITKKQFRDSLKEYFIVKKIEEIRTV